MDVPPLKAVAMNPENFRAGGVYAVALTLVVSGTLLALSNEATIGTAAISGAIGLLAGRAIGKAGNGNGGP